MDTQDLASLEKAYAENPSGDAFVPLSQAYLAQGRLMEAMVVCKKGIKTQPDNVPGRVILARVYVEQGKVQKAVEELKSLVDTGPSDPRAYVAYGDVLDKSGKTDDAIEAYKEALRKDRQSAEATAALAKHGVVWSPGPSPEELRAAEEAHQQQQLEAQRLAELAAQQAEAAARAAQSAAQHALHEATAPAQNVPAPAPRAKTPTSSGATPRAAPRPTQSQPAWDNDPALMGYAGAYGYATAPAHGASRRFGPGFTFGLGALLLLFLVGFVAFLKINKVEQEKVAAHLKAAQKGVLSDSTAGHRLALRELDGALAIDDEEPLAVAQKAISLAVLDVDRGERELDAEAKKALERAVKLAEDQPGTLSARMAFLRADNKPDEAIALADARRGAGEVSSLPVAVRVQLGRALIAAGKMDDAVKLADALKDVQDPSALAVAGDIYRRNGDKIRARAALDAALKVQLDHDPARALRALLILETDDVTNLGIALDDLRALKDLGKDAVAVRQRGYASLGMALAGAKIGRPERDNEVEAQNARALLKSDPEIPLFDAKKALGDKDFKKAVELGQAAINADKMRLEPYLTVVDAATRATDWAAADKALADAQAVFGDNLELGLTKAARLRDQERFDDALVALQGLLAKRDVAEVHRDIGKVLLKKGDFPGAVTSLRKAAEKSLTRAPGVKANVFMWLGRALAASGDDAQAVESYGEALAATTEFSTTYYFLATSLKKTGQNDAAKEALQKYLKADPNGQYVQKAKEALAEF